MGNDICEPIPGTADILGYVIRALIPGTGNRLGNDTRAPIVPATAIGLGNDIHEAIPGTANRLGNDISALAVPGTGNASPLAHSGCNTFYFL